MKSAIFRFFFYFST
ncbi:pheST operon leader peptide PheM [Shigella flexneri]